MRRTIHFLYNHHYLVCSIFSRRPSFKIFIKKTLRLLVAVVTMHLSRTGRPNSSLKRPLGIEKTEEKKVCATAANGSSFGTGAKNQSTSWSCP